MIGTMDVDPGIYPNVDFNDYCEWRGINFSVLRHFGKTPAHAYYEATHDKGTAAKDFGHLVHTAILEPDSLTKDYIVAPKVDKRTKPGKAAWAQFESKAAGRIVVTQEDYNRLRAISENCRSHATIRELLSGKGHNELSIVWDDEEFGIRCKARIDRLCEFRGQGYIVDIKTHGHPASTHSWQKSVADYDYHEQMAFYRRGIEALRPLADGAPERRSAWLVAESKEPNLVRLFDCDDDALQVGADESARHMARYAECAESGVWPGWDQGMEIAGLPAWVMKRYNID